MASNLKLLFTSLFFLFFSCNFNYNKKSKYINLFGKSDKINHNKIVFYNLENLFDIYDDPNKRDGEFTPNGNRKWNRYRFNDKLNKISKTIVALGRWRAPDIVGLCELENRYVLDRLIKTRALKELNYKIIHKDSPDRRGIDVAMIYRKDSFDVLHDQYFDVSNSKLTTRDILYVRGILNKVDTFSIFVNHWPSRYGGVLRSKKNRIFVANRLKKILKTMIKKYDSDYFVIMGDFNDQPNDESLNILQHKDFFLNISNNSISDIGYSYKYRNRWLKFDQIIVSKNLMKYFDVNLYYFSEKFLLIKDDKYNGFKPFRTYLGYKYLGGFSDHLPVYIQIYKK